ncbi:hypothetical protein CEH05_07725 [Halobacillus halophilus]|uniref:Uncharacterized protein n=1 Tax=Halobacillus halophilus (strain ATCC 35676 / DSM 2266 / JCM 20832 / KCTC 3685 / LMG 17431 / NBRC 102448 / NCIMB 2269) TaxID=866895 RepID=I0JL62_HALH3|nr:hypothetical protein CEH05_07725 [Halobacillus halophilus]CCG44882.1 conserved hypothetical protein [Halobacillus halophilus DSM 2266]
MKRYLLFIGSFTILYFIYQIGSGLLLTMNSTPESSFTTGPLPQEVDFGSRSLSFLVTLLIASLAYFISQLLKTQKS